MKSGVLIPLVGVLVAHLSPAQVPSIQASGVVQAGSVWKDVIKNLSGSSIVTLHATFDCIEADGRRVIDENGSHDALYQFSRDRDIPPGGSVVVRVSGHSQCSGGVDAVIFSDGHSEGDSGIIAAIYEKRQGLDKGLKYVIPLLDAVATGQTTTENAISVLYNRMNSVSHDMSRDVEDRSGEATAYGSVASDLRSQIVFSTPSDFTPNRQPRVDDLAKAKNIPRERALAMILENKYKEWLAALEGHTEPPEAK